MVVCGLAFTWLPRLSIAGNVMLDHVKTVGCRLQMGHGLPNMVVGVSFDSPETSMLKPFPEKDQLQPEPS